MPMQSFHEDLPVLSHQALWRRSAPKPRRSENCAVSTECQDVIDREDALELIEMRYQEHCARLNLEGLFAEEEVGCL